ncbi:phage tail fiber protein [Antarcticirhabdus aurantiaca]|uniref:Uncharacterized protein n=1 Tax=Antarcticirhabdus aurantiaca TaxID=2606717 RepID=A0ACD4NJ61_9HYPH|nr:hypothetical protein OXU80_18460 [Jeongeuplla avenae]
MSAFSNYMEQAICNWLRGTAMPAAPAALYVGLFNGSPTDTGSGGSEVTTQIRAAGRMAAAFAAPANSEIRNSAVVNFGSAASGTTISHFGVFDAASGGNLLMHGALTDGAMTVGAQTGVSFAANILVLGVSGFSDFLKAAILNWMRGTAMPSPPASIYVGLFNGNPTDAGSAGTEVTTQIRAAGRVLGAFSAPTDGVIRNTAAVDFGKAANASPLSHFGIFDAASAGNFLMPGPLDGGAKTVGAQTAVNWPANSLTLTVE